MATENRISLLWFLHTVELQWLDYHGCFELVLESLGKIPYLQIKDILE